MRQSVAFYASSAAMTAAWLSAFLASAPLQAGGGPEIHLICKPLNGQITIDLFIPASPAIFSWRKKKHLKVFDRRGSLWARKVTDSEFEDGNCREEFPNLPLNDRGYPKVQCGTDETAEVKIFSFHNNFTGDPAYDYDVHYLLFRETGEMIQYSHADCYYP